MMVGPRLPLVIVAAVARNGVIGRRGGLPWNLPGDLAHFRAVTTGHPLLMGRRTFEAIGRPLPDRLTTVLSTRQGFAPAAVTVARDVEAAFVSLDRQAARLGAPAIMVVGGAVVYGAVIGMATRLLITEIDAEPDGDALFPVLDPASWHLVDSREAERRPGEALRYRFTRWEKRQVA